MSRPRTVLLFVALLVAWTLLVGWFAARWGGAHAEGQVRDRPNEMSEDKTSSSATEAKAVAIDSIDTDRLWSESSSSYTTSLGTLKGDEVRVRTSSLDNGGLELDISNADGFSYKTTTIDLLHGPGSELLTRVKVCEFFDNGPKEIAWHKPSGWILVNRRDWSRFSDEHPLYVKFHLVDGVEPFGPCIQGLVRVPD